MRCEFCNKDHPHGVPKTMTDAGHPFLATHSRVGGFGYKVKGRYESLTSDEVERAKSGGWRKLSFATAYLR